eukprot:11537743-Alexandrium_andersonii.AAC.1
MCIRDRSSSSPALPPALADGGAGSVAGLDADTVAALAAMEATDLDRASVHKSSDDGSETSEESVRISLFGRPSAAPAGR